MDDILINNIGKTLLGGIAYGYAYLRIGTGSGGKRLREASIKEIIENIGYGILTLVIINLLFWGIVYIGEGVGKL